MSWLTQSVTGKLSQIGGQLKDILTESTEDVVDPVAELKVVKTELKGKNHHIEMLKVEATRWQDEANELILKCRTYEAQLEQKQTEFKQILLHKDAQIAEMQRQQSFTMVSPSSNLIDAGHFQKSALMEEFEELMPQSEYSDFIHLQKELKRLTEDNIHLINENKKLCNQIKNFEQIKSATETFTDNQKDLEMNIQSLKKEIFSLTVSNDKYQKEIITIQNSYSERFKSQMNEIESLKNQLNSRETSAKISSNKSDDGWCLNGDEINMDLIEKSESRKIESPVVIETSDKNEEITNLRKHVETIESELEKANEKIQRLRNNKVSSNSSKAVASQTTTYHVKNLEHISELDTLNANIESLRKENELANERIQNILSETKLSENALKQLNKNQEEQIDSLKLELKQLQQTINQEKIIQIQEHKQETQQLADLKAQTSSLKSNLNDKLNKIKLLNDEINDLNMNLACLKSNDLSLTNQLNISNQKILQLETEKEQLTEQKKQFEFMLEEKSRESSQLKNDVQKHLQHIGAQSKALEKLQAELKPLLGKHEKDKETEEVAFLKQQYNEIYSCLEQKNQESLSYYNEIQRLNLVVSDLNKEIMNAKNFNENLTEQYENLVKEFQVEQKMVDELNLHIVDLSEQTSSLAKDSFHFKKEINDQEQERSENFSNESSPQLIDRDKIKKEIEDNLLKEEQNKLFEVKEKNRQIFEQMQFQIDQLIQEKDKLERNQEFIINQCNSKLSELHSQFTEQQKAMVEQMQLQLSQERENFLSKENNKTNELNNKYNETVAQYEIKLEALTESYSNETQRNQQMIKELNRLKEHLVEISESFNKEAIQAEEREKYLRLKLTEAEKSLEQFDATIETSSKELEEKLERLTQTNQELKNENDKLKERLKKNEETLNHQIKVTKNLELVLERLQNEKDSQNSNEIYKYQQTIKEHANLIKSLQKEALCYQDEISSLKDLLEAASLIEIELNKKDDFVKQLIAQISTKDAVIESLEKHVNEIQKLNDSYIEKEIIKNLIIGYIKVNQAQERKQVLKLISMMLNFSQAELEQAESLGESKWFGLVKSSPAKNPQQNKVLSSSDSGSNKSFTELLIQYVDRESKPRPSLAFDLDSTTNKKTDSPEKLISNNSSLLSNHNSASAVRFFNNSLITSPINNTDLTLINRNQLNQDLTTSSSRTTDSPANAFLEQILK